MRYLPLLSIAVVLAGCKKKDEVSTDKGEKLAKAEAINPAPVVGNLKDVSELQELVKALNEGKGAHLEDIAKYAEVQGSGRGFRKDLKELRDVFDNAFKSHPVQSSYAPELGSDDEIALINKNTWLWTAEHALEDFNSMKRSFATAINDVTNAKSLYMNAQEAIKLSADVERHRKEIENQLAAITDVAARTNLIDKADIFNRAQAEKKTIDAECARLVNKNEELVSAEKSAVLEQCLLSEVNELSASFTTFEKQVTLKHDASFKLLKHVSKHLNDEAKTVNLMNKNLASDVDADRDALADAVNIHRADELKRASKGRKEALDERNRIVGILSKEEVDKADVTECAARQSRQAAELLELRKDAVVVAFAAKRDQEKLASDRLRILVGEVLTVAEQTELRQTFPHLEMNISKSKALLSAYVERMGAYLTNTAKYAETYQSGLERATATYNKSQQDYKLKNSDFLKVWRDIKLRAHLFETMPAAKWHKFKELIEKISKL